MITSESITNLFKDKAAKILVMLALAGIALSAYPIYNNLYSTGQKIALIKEWNSLNYKPLPSEALDTVYDQLSSELERGNGIIEPAASILSKISPYSFETCLIKAVTGSVLYFLIYGTILIFLLRLNRRKGLWKALLKRNLHVFAICIILSIINTALPFISILINCIFIPSCLTLVVALFSLLWNEVSEHINKIKNPSEKKQYEEIIVHLHLEENNKD